jgi:hypothetical protein
VYDWTFIYFLFFEAKSTHFCRLLRDTRPSIVIIVVLWSCRRKLQLCDSPVTNAWSSRPWESSFQIVQGGARGLWSLICCRVILGMAHVLHMLFSKEDNPCRQLELGFSVLLCLCIHLISSVTVCLYITQFYWNICWLVSK